METVFDKPLDKDIATNTQSIADLETLSDISSELTSIHSDIKTIKLLKNGHAYSFQFLTNNDVTLNWTTIAAIPTSYLPNHTIYFPVYNAVTGEIIPTGGLLNMDGTVMVNCPTSGAYLTYLTWLA